MEIGFCGMSGGTNVEYGRCAGRRQDLQCEIRE